MTSWTKNDDLFRRLLKEGHGWQVTLAKMLLEEGLTVYVPPLRWRKSYADIDEFKDDRDITVGSSVQLWLEVKSSYVSFTGPDDIPDPFKLVTTSSWRKLEEKPFGVAVISKRTGAVVFAPTKFQSEWSIKSIKDRMRGFEEPWLMCRREHLFSYPDLVKVLKARTR